MSVPAADPSLAECLQQLSEPLVGTWVGRVRAVLPTYRARPPGEIERWGTELLEAVAAAAAAGDTGPLDRHAGRVTRERYRLGFPVEEVIQACLLVKEAAAEVLVERRPDARRLLSTLDLLVRLLVAQFAREFTTTMRAQQEQVVALEERHRLARDLHDSVSQSLCGVTMYAEAAARLLAAGQPARAAEHLAQLRADALDAQREMRRMIYELRPATLEARGLVPALRERLAAVEARAGVETTLEGELPERLSHPVEDALYGIAQEALNNALRHGRATRIRVLVGRHDARAAVEVQDNGRGFDAARLPDGGGLGLIGMRERAARVRGELTIESSPGRGTRVVATVPLAARRTADAE
jgi:signal transduction histidine kinase